MLETKKIYNTTNFHVDVKDLCVFCLEPTGLNNSVSHVDASGKLKHVVSCSFNCIKSTFLSFRKNQGEVVCPICREKIVSLDGKKILSQNEVDQVRLQISLKFLKHEFSEINKLAEDLKDQFTEDYLTIELIAPPALAANDSKIFQEMLHHMKKSAKNNHEWLAVFFLAHHFNQSNWAESVWNAFCFQHFKQNPFKPSAEISEELIKALSFYEQLCQRQSMPIRYIKMLTILADKISHIKTLKNVIASTILVINDYETNQASEDLIQYFQMHKNLLQTLKVDSSRPAKEVFLELAIVKSDIKLLTYLLETFSYDQKFLNKLKTSLSANENQIPISEFIFKKIEAIHRENIRKTIISIVALPILATYLYNRFY